MNKIFISIFIFIIILFSQIIKLVANDDTYINSSNITYNEKENIVELAENSKINLKIQIF
jgi:energy-converting hydrogenase Eha subunit H